MLELVFALSLVSQTCSGLDAGCAPSAYLCVAPDAAPADTGIHPDAAAPDAAVDAGVSDAGVAYATTSRTIVVSGLSRTYLEDLPANPSAGMDVVVGFHGQSWSASGFRGEYASLIQQTTRPTVWLWMQGTGPTTIPNAEGSAVGWYPENRTRDLAFLSMALASIQSRFGAPSRVIALGRSHGGGIAYDAFVRSAVDRAILVSPYLTSTTGTRVAPILVLTNTADPIVSLASSLSARMTELAGAFGCARPWPTPPGTGNGAVACETAACGPLRICLRRDASHFYPTVQAAPEMVAFLRGS